MIIALPSGLKIYDHLSFLFILGLLGLEREQISCNDIVLFQLYFNAAKHIPQSFRKELSDCLFTFFFFLTDAKFIVSSIPYVLFLQIPEGTLCYILRI